MDGLGVVELGSLVGGSHVVVVVVREQRREVEIVFVFCFVVEKLKPSLVLLLSFSSLRDSDRVQCSQAEIINREIELRS